MDWLRNLFLKNGSWGLIIINQLNLIWLQKLLIIVFLIQNCYLGLLLRNLLNMLVVRLYLLNLLLWKLPRLW